MGCFMLPIPEIVAIVGQKFSLIESTDAAADIAMKRAEVLRQSLLTRAFRGGESSVVHLAVNTSVDSSVGARDS